MKILVGYDGSNQAKEALNLAKKHAQAFNAYVYVVYSLKKGSQTTAGEIDQAKEWLEYTKQFFSASGIPVETHLLVRGVTPGEDLVQFAQEHDVDEIIVGIKKTSPVGKIVFGSNARHVILNADCPVVTVK
ncbi:MAG: universal stress protein [Desulfomonilaceae bacterium]|jgi:nucleotide-binding universal stress UspA family protein